MFAGSRGPTRQEARLQEKGETEEAERGRGRERRKKRDPDGGIALCVRVGRCTGRQNGADQYSWPACRVVPAKSVEGGFMRILPSDSPFPRTNPFPSILSRFLSNLRETRARGDTFRHPNIIIHARPSFLFSFSLLFFSFFHSLRAILHSNRRF